MSKVLILDDDQFESVKGIFGLWLEKNPSPESGFYFWKLNKAFKDAEQAKRSVIEWHDGFPPRENKGFYLVRTIRGGDHDIEAVATIDTAYWDGKRFYATAQTTNGWANLPIELSDSVG